MNTNPYNNPAMLHELFTYDKATGRLHHAKDKRTVKAGDYADTNISGQQRRTNLRIGGKNKQVPTRDVVWVMCNGPIPDGCKVVLDGKDLAYATHIEQLRLVQQQELEFDIADVHLNFAVLAGLFQYCPESGRITRRTGQRAGQFADTTVREGTGRVVSASCNGEYRQFSAARVAYALGTGAVVPDDVPLYHLNGDMSDNRLVNLSIGSPETAAKRKQLEEQIRTTRLYLSQLRADLAELNATEYA